MSFKQFITEKKQSFKAPRGFFDDESFVDDFDNEMQDLGLVWDEDFFVSDDNTTITFEVPVTAEIKQLLKSFKFK